ncbi:hypothetical protein JTE90_028709 [Oedothorax gibbosus]|uniref:ATP synthase subunit C lysine N-methyltransferase n=1 Tax=Oedothorax gibbosus TaxID=931172 RepID=A0AAV6U3X5_9ARAC|nr:hypothetical protein JTE90_028709 [Oedothorax gibbosus]
MSVRNRNFYGLVAVGAFGTVALGLMAGCAPFVMPAFRRICLPYVPATDNQIKNVVAFLKTRKGNVIDLGSGDGRIVMSAAKLGFNAIGVELNPWLVIYSKLKALHLGLNRKAAFKRQDIWKTELKEYENVVIFGVEQMMPQLEVKLKQELAEDACVIACRFPLPNWKEVATSGKGIDTVWLYSKKSL